MTGVLGDVCDKVPTVGTLWGWGVLLSMVALLGVAGRGWAKGVLGVCIALSAFLGYAAVHEAFWAGEFSRAIQTEMGCGWIVSSIGAALMPTLAGVIVYWGTKRTERMRA